MAGEDTTAADGGVTTPLRLVGDVVRISGDGFSGFFKRDCTDLARRVSLLAHLLEEIRDSKKIQVNCEVGSSSFSSSCFADLTLALQAAKRLVFAANNFENSKFSSNFRPVDKSMVIGLLSIVDSCLRFGNEDGATKKIVFQFQCVTWKLEKALANLPYDDFDISEEVQEQVELVRAQLRRATERYAKQQVNRSLHLENIGNIDHEVNTKLEGLAEECRSENHASDEVRNSENLRNSSTSSEVSVLKESDSTRIDSSSRKSLEENKKPDSLVIPDDFRCPISLELMRDPVIVATGQTYERSYIQRWIDCGNTTCPNTQQKLQHLTLTPNYVLRSLISQWCVKHNIEQLTALTNGRIKKSDGSFRDVTGDIAAIESLKPRHSNPSQSINADDAQIQDNTVTCILNLSIYDNNKGLIMLANAIPSIVQILRAGSMEAKENAAATLFSLSLADENKIIIGASGAIPALVDLLENGSPRGKKDAATALFNLCIYQGNKGRAVRAGIVNALLKMLTDSSSCMVDEALTILSVLASHQEAKSAILKANMIHVLIDILGTGSPRSKENSAAILLSLCKRDNANLACLSRLGAVMHLSELAENGTERAKRKAMSLLEHIRKSQQCAKIEELAEHEFISVLKFIAAYDSGFGMEL
ncbi:hypothetical protein DH2020_032017 [Rehmannia glutinosa]|uniref:RING-type E3 ubiquitin transferase n=1 Tax=Rehmannia glutinosa TaxID=99300 RepID=A0ABR0VH45_REHGL